MTTTIGSCTYFWFITTNRLHDDSTMAAVAIIMVNAKLFATVAKFATNILRVVRRPMKAG